MGHGRFKPVSRVAESGWTGCLVDWDRFQCAGDMGNGKRNRRCFVQVSTVLFSQEWGLCDLGCNLSLDVCECVVPVFEYIADSSSLVSHDQNRP